MAEVMSVSRFPFADTVEPVPNDPRIEWMFGALMGHPAPRQKRLIMQARQSHVGIIDDGQAERLLSALGLESA